MFPESTVLGLENPLSTSTQKTKKAGQDEVHAGHSAGSKSMPAVIQWKEHTQKDGWLQSFQGQVQDAYVDCYIHVLWEFAPWSQRDMINWSYLAVGLIKDKRCKALIHDELDLALYINQGQGLLTWSLNWASVRRSQESFWRFGKWDPLSCAMKGKASNESSTKLPGKFLNWICGKFVRLTAFNLSVCRLRHCAIASSILHIWSTWSAESEEKLPAYNLVLSRVFENSEWFCHDFLKIW